MSALKGASHTGGFVAEIHVEPKRGNRGIIWIVLIILVAAVLAWYFLAGPGAGV